jgi:hypothetical protein
MKDKNQIITDMCYTYRHDYGLRKDPNEPHGLAGMTDQDAKMLYKTMEQIYTNNIKPHLKELQDVFERSQRSTGS